MTLIRPGVPDTERVLLTIVQNTSPWTYFGTVPIDPCPHASFETGLDVFAVRRMDPLTTARAARRMLTRSGGLSRSGIIVWHDQHGFAVHARTPVPVQVDGEALGPTRAAEFAAFSEALRVMGS